MPIKGDISLGTNLGDGYSYIRKAVIGDNTYHTVMDKRRTERLIIFSPAPDERDTFIVLSDSSSTPVIENLSNILGLVKVKEEDKNMFIYKAKKVIRR